MPFTLAHPAAVIPLKKLPVGRHLILSALVVGSMAPDFGYFVPGADFSGVSHSLAGAFIFDVPVGLLTLWLFHQLKQPLLHLLPPSHRQRLEPLAQPLAFAPWSQFLLIVLSLLIGALTHIGWDSMTHGHGWMVQHVPLFQAKLLTLAGKPLIVYFVLKHSSSILGLLLLGYWYWVWHRAHLAGPAGATSSPSGWRLLPMAIICLVIAPLGGIILAVLSAKVGYTTAKQAVRSLTALAGAAGLIYGIVAVVKSRLLLKNKYD